MTVNALDRIKMAQYTAFQWRSELSVLKKVALALGMACLTGLIAQARVYLPWTPVPVTGQTFAALLAGVMLGQWWGGASMLLYAGLGIAGVPWFTGWSGGIAHLAGPTGGYVIGFILAALFIGYVSDKFIRARTFPAMLGLMLVANIVLIYVPGLIQLNLWRNLVTGTPTSIPQTLALGAAPFIVGDVLKAAAAAGVGWAITPKKEFGKNS